LLLRNKSTRDRVQAATDRHGGVEISEKAAAKFPPIARLSQIRRLQDDLVQMDEVHAASVLHNLRERFLRDKIYSSIADILICINPFKRLPLYTPAIMAQYATRGQTRLPPHPYLVADHAYRCVTLERKPASIIMSGDSGAGKTEATKQCLSFLADRAGSVTGVEQQVLAANPFLEAFGNAKTVRNRNSSRFGKYMEIDLDRVSGNIVGCKITNYLLEKSRICRAGDGERSFHIFYQARS